MFWSHRRQTVLRIFFSIAGVLLIAWLAGSSVQFDFSQVSATFGKIRLTAIRQYSATLSVRQIMGLFTVLCLGALFGLPNPFLLLPLFLLYGPGVAVIVVVLLHFLALNLVLLLARKFPADCEALRKTLEQNDVSIVGLAFWLRLYPVIPLRTVDVLLRHAIISRGSRAGVNLATILGLSIRVGVQGLFLNYLSHVLIAFRPFPEMDTICFLLSFGVFFVLTLLPKIPELLIGPQPSKMLILHLAGELPRLPETEAALR